jgi:hypothetical protein
VAPLSADESGAKRMSRKPTRDAGSVWATWFPRDGKPQTFIQGFQLEGFELSGKAQTPFHFGIGKNEIHENSCRGELGVDGHVLSWDLHYRSTFGATLSSKGWIGFSRTPHSDAFFSGYITLDGRRFEGDPLGFGVQGHNCGYRHRNFWTWAHACFPRPGGSPSTIEALVYEMPFGLVFRKAVLWHEGKEYVFRNVRDINQDSDKFGWNFQCVEKCGLQLEARFDGAGSNVHRLPYLKTDCSGSFEVANNSLARAAVRLQRRDGSVENLETATGGVLETVGRRSCGLEIRD